VALYLATGFILSSIYGPSFPFLEGGSYWTPDGEAGWMKVGEPSTPAPQVPSELVPPLLLYLPVYLPGLVLALFLFTPLGRYLEPRRDEPGEGASADESEPETEEGQQ
jgi:hypothetical protein